MYPTNPLVPPFYSSSSSSSSSLPTPVNSFAPSLTNPNGKKAQKRPREGASNNCMCGQPGCTPYNSQLVKSATSPYMFPSANEQIQYPSFKKINNPLFLERGPQINFLAKLNMLQPETNRTSSSSSSSSSSDNSNNSSSSSLSFSSSLSSSSSSNNSNNSSSSLSFSSSSSSSSSSNNSNNSSSSLSLSSSSSSSSSNDITSIPLSMQALEGQVTSNPLSTTLNLLFGTTLLSDSTPPRLQIATTEILNNFPMRPPSSQEASSKERNSKKNLGSWAYNQLSRAPLHDPFINKPKSNDATSSSSLSGRANKIVLNKKDGVLKVGDVSSSSGINSGLVGDNNGTGKKKSGRGARAGTLNVSTNPNNKRIARTSRRTSETVISTLNDSPNTVAQELKVHKEAPVVDVAKIRKKISEAVKGSQLPCYENFEKLSAALQGIAQISDFDKRMSLLMQIGTPVRHEEDGKVIAEKAAQMWVVVPPTDGSSKQHTYFRICCYFGPYGSKILVEDKCFGTKTDQHFHIKVYESIGSHDARKDPPMVLWIRASQKHGELCWFGKGSVKSHISGNLVGDLYKTFESVLGIQMYLYDDAQVNSPDGTPKGNQLWLKALALGRPDGKTFYERKLGFEPATCVNWQQFSKDNKGIITYAEINQNPESYATAFNNVKNRSLKDIHQFCIFDILALDLQRQTNGNYPYRLGEVAKRVFGDEANFALESCEHKIQELIAKLNDQQSFKNKGNGKSKTKGAKSTARPPQNILDLNVIHNLFLMPRQAPLQPPPGQIPPEPLTMHFWSRPDTIQHYQEMNTIANTRIWTKAPVVLTPVKPSPVNKKTEQKEDEEKEVVSKKSKNDDTAMEIEEAPIPKSEKVEKKTKRTRVASKKIKASQESSKKTG